MSLPLRKSKTESNFDTWPLFSGIEEKREELVEPTTPLISDV